MRHIFKPEPNVLKLLHIISSSTFQKLPIISTLLSFHYLLFPYYSVCFVVLAIDIQRNMDYIYFCCSYVLSNISDVQCVYISKMINEKHPHLSLNYIISHVTVMFNNYWLFFNHACEHPIILKLCLGVSYNFSELAQKNSNLYGL